MEGANDPSQICFYLTPSNDLGGVCLRWASLKIISPKCSLMFPCVGEHIHILCVSMCSLNTAPFQIQLQHRMTLLRTSSQQRLFIRHLPHVPSATSWTPHTPLHSSCFYGTADVLPSVLNCACGRINIPIFIKRYSSNLMGWNWNKQISSAERDGVSFSERNKNIRACGRQ